MESVDCVTAWEHRAARICCDNRTAHLHFFLSFFLRRTRTQASHFFFSFLLFFLFFRFPCFFYHAGAQESSGHGHTLFTYAGRSVLKHQESSRHGHTLTLEHLFFFLIGLLPLSFFLCLLLIHLYNRSLSWPTSFMMSAPILIPLTHCSFDLHVHLKQAMEREVDAQRPESPTPSEYSSLSSLPPSPDLRPSDITPPSNGTSTRPPPFFLNPIDSTPASSPPQKKQRQERKKKDKVKPKHRKARQNAAASTARSKRRSQMAESNPLVQARPGPRMKYLGKALPIVVDGFDTQQLPAAKTGYIGNGGPCPKRQSVTLKDAIGKHKLGLQKWDGRSALFLCSSFSF